MSLALASVIAFSAPAMATTANIPFNASIAGTCIINMLTPGTLAVDGTLQNLNSLGAPGTISVMATSNTFKFSMDTPTLLRPPTDTTPLNSIGGAWHATGATTTNQFDTAAPYTLNQGLTNMNIFFFSGKTGNNIFTAGVYTANVTVRCE
jgi:hypothetical protein